ncbi:MAG: HD domain-containing protein [Nanoarchaeota archaeon]|nr:HD domain-containing protein [Nanoarchaeota archaeon]
MLSEPEAIALMKKHAQDDGSLRAVLAHSKLVQGIALRIAAKFPESDKDFIRIACILHDIGRLKTQDPLQHGIKGAEILRKKGLKEFADVCERHLGAGISKEEIMRQELPLPPRDFLPKTIEEKIITAADNLTENDREISREQSTERFRKELGEDVARKITALFDELGI